MLCSSSAGSTIVWRRGGQIAHRGSRRRHDRLCNGGGRNLRPSHTFHCGGGSEVAPQEDAMPARSKKQQMAAGAALAAKRGERSKQSLKGASRGNGREHERAAAARVRPHQTKGSPAQAQGV